MKMCYAVRCLFGSYSFLFLGAATQAGIILGTGRQYLVGKDLTDPLQINGASIAGIVTAVGMTVGSEGAFGEHAYRVFDNGVEAPPPNGSHSPDKSKVCCGGGGGSGSITFQFSNGPQVIRSYTLSSANDTPARDPIEWQILGSNDGVNFTLIDHVVGNTWSARHQVQLFNNFSEGLNATAYEYIRYAPLVASGGGTQHQLAEIEYLSHYSRSAGTILGVGTAALLGGDLTDPENDGAPDADVNYNMVFSSDNKAFFGATEGAFNIFDNRVGGGNDKWCCDDASPGNALFGPGHQVNATFTGGKQAFLTHFTIGSSNDTPGRDPRIWGIYGSNDGVDFDLIFMRAHETDSVWTDRNQVVLFQSGVDFEVQTTAYSTFRLSIQDTVNGSQSSISELELFGNVIPEPQSAFLLLAGFALLPRLRRLVRRA